MIMLFAQEPYSSNEWTNIYKILYICVLLNISRGFKKHYNNEILGLHRKTKIEFRFFSKLNFIKFLRTLGFKQITFSFCCCFSNNYWLSNYQ